MFQNKNLFIILILILTTTVFSKEPNEVPYYMYDTFSCTHVSTVEVKDNKLEMMTQDSHVNIFRLTITPKTIKWREYEEYTSHILQNESTLNGTYANIKIEGKPYLTNTFTMYNFKNQGLYTTISEFDNQLWVHTYDCTKSTEYKEQEKKDWYEADKPSIKQDTPSVH